MSEAMFLRLGSSDDDYTDLPVVGIGGTARVAIGRVGLRSSIWRFWANPSTSDLYVSSRTVAGVQKYSFHQSGDFRYAWTTREHALAYSGSEERILDRWSRPPSDVNGWTRVLSIWTRAEDITPIVGDDTRQEEVLWLAPPQPGSARAIHVALVRPDLGTLELKGMAPLEVIRLASGEAAAILTGTTTVDDDQQRTIETDRAKALALLPGLQQLQGTPGTRVGLFGHGTDDVRWVWDTALDPVQPHLAEVSPPTDE